MLFYDLVRLLHYVLCLRFVFLCFKQCSILFFYSLLHICVSLLCNANKHFLLTYIKLNKLGSYITAVLSTKLLQTDSVGFSVYKPNCYWCDMSGCFRLCDVTAEWTHLQQLWSADFKDFGPEPIWVFRSQRISISITGLFSRQNNGLNAKTVRKKPTLSRWHPVIPRIKSTSAKGKRPLELLADSFPTACTVKTFPGAVVRRGIWNDKSQTFNGSKMTPT